MSCRVRGRISRCTTETEQMSSVVPAGDRGGNAGVSILIGDARSGASDSLGRLLQLYRNYLTILATTQLNARLRARVSPSDLVQETMLAAVKAEPARDQLRQ